MAEPEQPQGRIVPDEDVNSAIDMPIESTASLRSSILKYHEENGRTYHALSSGQYILPNDEGEQERLDIVHHILLLTFDGKLCLSPKNESAKSVLDMGTGTGAWAIDFSDAHPEARVIGVDLSPIQPTFTPPNCAFEVDDLEKEWTWGPGRFDLIFCRSLAGSFASWPKIMEKAFNHLEPGGYFEIHDNLFPVLCDDGTLPADSALVRWCNLMVEGASKLGRNLNEAPKYAGWLTEAGFDNITTKLYKWPINRWPKDPKFKELGAWTLTAMDGGLEGLCLAVFTRALGWTQDETLAFCSAVRQDLRNPRYHGYWQIYVTYGEKPEAEAS